jgi:hypothetical protein
MHKSMVAAGVPIYGYILRREAGPADRSARGATEAGKA